MPCRDYEDPAEDYRRMKSHADDLARMLCEVMRLVERWDVPITRKTFSSELITWWKTHKKADARALEEERKEQRRQAMRDKALAKLTKKERELLFGRSRTDEE